MSRSRFICDAPASELLLEPQYKCIKAKGKIGREGTQCLILNHHPYQQAITRKPSKG